MNDIEKQRIAGLKSAEKDFDGKLNGFLPDGFGCHEALHMASVTCDDVENRLMNHPAILLNAEWYAKAAAAQDALFELYQAIGAVHLAKETGID